MTQAVLMAAGKSTRTYPLTLTKPKPLLHIANKPILAHQLDQCLGLVQEAVIIVGYKHEMLRSHFGESYRDIQLTYVEQKEQLGTGHAVMQVDPYIKDRFLVMNGDDLYARADIEGCLQYHYSLLAQPVEDPRPYGVLTIDANGLVKDLIEKPDNPASNLTNVGMYVFDRGVFDILKTIPQSPRGEYEVTDAVKRLAQTAEVHCYVSQAYWIPVGFPWGILNANDFLLEQHFAETMSRGSIEEGVKIGGKVSLGENAVIRQGAYLQGNLYVGRNCVIGPNCHITGNTAIGDGTRIGTGSTIKNCVIGQQVNVDPFCHLLHTVVDDNVTIGTGMVTMSAPLETKTVTSMIKGEVVASDREQFGATIGDGACIQPHVVTYPGVKIAPDTVIPPGTVVEHDLP